MLAGVLPLLALQIHAVSVSIHMLNQDLSETGFALISCLVMTVFAILFGARHISTQNKHEGLVVAIALESVIKLIAIAVIAVSSVIGVFGGFAEFGNWFDANQTSLAVSESELSEGAARSLLLLLFAGVVTMPHVFHMMITENSDERVLASARWGFPLYLLAFSIAIPPIYLASVALGITGPAEFHALGIGLRLGSAPLTMLAFVGGLAAASGVLIVITLALSSMTLNHVLLPLVRPRPGGRVIRSILTIKRALIATIFLAAYLLYRLFVPEQQLGSLGLVAFVATLQFLPGLILGFYWRRATRIGFLAGLGCGSITWFLTLMLPLINDLVTANVVASIPLLYELNEASWHNAARLSLTANTVVLICVSLLTKQSPEEALAARECSLEDSLHQLHGELIVTSVSEIKAQLTKLLGEELATQAIHRILGELSLSPDERRPHALRQIREKIEAYVSEIVGQTIARQTTDRLLPYKTTGPVADPVHTIEQQLDGFQREFTGFAAELDTLRRYHRQILEDLPSAVCTVSLTGHILTWNRAMEALTSIPSDRIVGGVALQLPEPWNEILDDFLLSDSPSKQKVKVPLEPRLLINLHKAPLEAPSTDTVIVTEDITETHLLEQQLLHKERLASIGQLAAGVAHEIGNPITGIACLAQDLKFEDSDTQTLADEILRQTERVSTILQTLVNFAHGGGTETTHSPIPVQIHQCIDESIKLLSLSQSHHTVAMVNNADSRLYVRGDPQRLSQVVINILANARDASKLGSSVSIRTDATDSHVALHISDTGHGIPDLDIERVFEPFFTTKRTGTGTGLGLAIASTIIKEHHGEIKASSPHADGTPGTQVIIKLPRYFPDADSPTSHAETRAATSDTTLRSARR